jgi:hypothetical protein
MGAIMAHGLHAELSPNEEVTLRCIALATGGERYAEAHLHRLAQLNLIESARGSWRLTALGRQRYDSLTKPLLRTEGSGTNEIDRIPAMHNF